MAMFEDFPGDYPSASRSSCSSLTDSSSSGSFYAWDDACTTPPTPAQQDTLDSMKLEDISFHPASTPEGYGTSNGMSSMSLLTFDTVPGFPEHNMLLPEGKMMQNHAMMGFNSFSNFTNNEEYGTFSSSHGLTANTPVLETDLSSPVSIDFVVPSQTTFVNTFEMQSPMRSLHFNSPSSEYNSNLSVDRSPMENLSFYSQYEDCKSASTTPSRATSISCRASILRQPTSGPAWTSAALQNVQSDPDSGRNKEKRMRREVTRGAKRAHHAEIQPASGHLCMWPKCGKKFKRSEHLKRHEKTHIPGPPEICPSCGHLFKGSRADNKKTHMKLHKDGSKRTKQDERVGPLLEQMERERGKKKGKAGTERQLREGVKLDESSTKTRSRIQEY